MPSPPAAARTSGGPHGSRGHLALSALGHAALSILADPRGAPRLEGASAAGVHIALAHGRRVAAAFASQTGARFVCVGVDVVDPEDAARIGRLEARVLTENERALAAGDPEIRLLAWGAREAVAKATSTGMFAFAMRAIAINRVDRAQKRIEVEVTAPAADPGGHPPAPTDPTRAAMTEAGVEVAYEPLGAGGVLVFAGCSLDFARGARASAGL